MKTRHNQYSFALSIRSEVRTKLKTYSHKPFIEVFLTSHVVSFCVKSTLN